jgi:hypothetical protein
MTRHLPKWRSLEEELNRFMLAHETWASQLEGSEVPE